MSIWQAIFLGILQGATEFIPVSSSGHLVLVPWLLGWGPPGLTFSVAVHLGTITAIMGYFWRDFWGMVTGSLAWVRDRGTPDNDFRLALLIVLSAIPAAVIGILFEDLIAEAFETPLFAAAMLSVTGAILLIGERLGRLVKDIPDMSFLDALLIGFGQALAIVPGISRSGSTIATARLRNMEREPAARFSFLMSTPVILGAGLLQVIELVETGITGDQFLLLSVGFVSAALSSYVVIHWLLNFLKTRSIAVFAVYCFVASALSVVVFFIRG